MYKGVGGGFCHQSRQGCGCLWVRSTVRWLWRRHTFSIGIVYVLYASCGGWMIGVLVSAGVLNRCLQKYRIRIESGVSAEGSAHIVMVRVRLWLWMCLIAVSSSGSGVTPSLYTHSLALR